MKTLFDIGIRRIGGIAKVKDIRRLGLLKASNLKYQHISGEELVIKR